MWRHFNWTFSKYGQKKHLFSWIGWSCFSEKNNGKDTQIYSFFPVYVTEEKDMVLSLRNIWVKSLGKPGRIRGLIFILCFIFVWVSKGVSVFIYLFLGCKMSAAHCELVFAGKECLCTGKQILKMMVPSRQFCWLILIKRSSKI